MADVVEVKPVVVRRPRYTIRAPVGTSTYLLVISPDPSERDVLSLSCVAWHELNTIPAMTGVPELI